MSAATRTTDASIVIKSEERQSLRLSRVISLTLTLLGLLITGFGLVYLLLLALGWYDTPFLGVLTSDTLVVNGTRPLTGEEWGGFSAGLRTYDQITRIKSDSGDVVFDANDPDTANKLNQLLSAQHRGQAIQVEVLRPGPAKIFQPQCSAYTLAGAQCSYQVTLTRMPLVDFLAQFGVGFIVGIGFLILGIVTFALRPNLIPARLVANMCAAMAVLTAGRFELVTTHQTILLWALAGCVLGSITIELALVFPYEMPLIRRNPTLRFVPLILGLCMFLLCYTLYQQHTTRTYDSIQLAATTIGVIGSGLLVAAMANRRRQSPSPIAREQAGMVLIAGLLAITPVLLWVITIVLERLFGWTWLTFPSLYVLPSTLIFPLGLIYSLLQHRLLDSDRIISEGLIYTFLGAMLVIAYSFVTFAVYLLTWGLLRWDNPILIALTIFVIAVSFSPARLRLERIVDRTFFKQRRLYESRIEAFSRRLTLLTDLQDVTREFKTQLGDTVMPQYVFTFLRNLTTGEYEAIVDPATDRPETDIHFSPGSALLNYLAGPATILYIASNQPLPPELASDRARLAVLNTPVIARLRSASRLNGFVAIGPRRDRNQYNFEDLRFIEGLAEQAALAFERAQVIIEAQRNERELRVLSQVSAALNITMDFDTLLEFIYTQTDKVIRAPNFYIALRTPGTEDLSFAFYQEAGERLPEKEGRRWHIGHDLLSEVVRLQQPIKTDNYVVESARRDPHQYIDNPHLRAWMGVPLNAGTGSALGVAVVATTDAAISYTEDQMSIFSSIADLAATALDKARLFRETEERARQLAVLNDISTQLAAEFENVDALLGIITSSAIEILRAEAGSLLLKDQTSGDLVFSLAIGGGGADLVGTRIPPGVGIAGKVVETGKYVIVNDAASDSNWFGEVHEKTDSRTFHTDAILAVPLIARGSVIGVLEIVNKRDRSRYLDSDVNLLTTFASQAAIAIENARLFQMTDQQLATRVQQLDNMQRIDQELNRTLDLRAVIDLTLDNALRESNADAGALAIVRTDPLGFEVVGSLGYPKGTFTPGEIYPIDMGVIGRVYRTGSASMVTELADDADYLETLPGAVGQLAVPMTTAGKGVTAVLLLETRVRGVFNMMNMSFITALAEHANTAITNSQLFMQLQQANEARSQFVGFVAHELKNPMTSIKGYAEVLLGGMAGSLSEQQQNVVAIVRRNVVRMQQIVDDLRDLAALETGVLTVKLTPISFNNVVLETLRPQQRAIDDKQQKLVLEVPENLPLIMGDENRLIQVLTNFVSNANKYTPDGGTITLRAESIPNQWDPDGAPEVIHCSISDTGIGMDEDDLKKLSTPYFRSSNQRAQDQPGTGLGMTITYALVEAHGGMVWAESELEVGTTFHFTIPLALESEKVQPSVRR